MKTRMLSKREGRGFRAGDQGAARVKHLVLRARVRQCDGDLVPLLKRAAEILRLDEADVIRIGTQQYAASVVYRVGPMSQLTESRAGVTSGNA